MHGGSHALGSAIGGIAGIVLIAVALVASVPVAMNLPGSWPAAALVLVVAATGIALIVAHVRLGHRAREGNQKR